VPNAAWPDTPADGLLVPENPATEISGCEVKFADATAQNIDVMLINPQYGQSLVKDVFYEEVVTAIAQVAQDAQVPVVDRFGGCASWMRPICRRFFPPTVCT
jgi:hypothetical protein